MAGDLARAGARDGFSESCNEINMSVLLLAFTFCERINAATPAGCIESSFSKLRLRTRSCPHECRPAYFFLFFFSNCSCATLLVNALLYCTHAPFQQRFFFCCLLIVAIVNGSCLASQLRFIENLQQSLQSALVPGAWTLYSPVL